MKYIIALIITFVVAFMVYSFHRHYPFGLPSGKLSTLMPMIEYFARDNGGWYPKDGQTPLASMQLLYPKYCDAAALAGLSGNQKEVSNRIKAGHVIDTNISSWIYYPGFRNDDPEGLAILWEQRSGLSITGSRYDGHAVGFVRGGYGQVSSKDWAQFLKEQEEMRHKILMKREMKETNATVKGNAVGH